MSTPNGGNNSPFAARTRAPFPAPAERGPASTPPMTPPPGKPTPAPAPPPPPEKPAPKKSSAPVIVVVVCILAAAAGAGLIMSGKKPVEPAAVPAPTGGAAAQAPASATAPVVKRDAKADYTALADRASKMTLEPAQRAVLAQATLRASGGAYADAVSSLGPVVTRSVEATYADEASALRGIKLEEHTTPEAQKLRLALAQADAAAQTGVWAESVARREEAIALVPLAQTEIAVQLASVATAAVGRGDLELATYFYERVLRLAPQQAAARAHLYAYKFKPAQALRSSIGVDLVYVPPGDFVRGSRAGEPGRATDEVQAKVRLTRGFFLGVNEVTQRQWDAVFGAGAAARVITTAPAKSKALGPDLPMHSIRWDEAREFCAKLSALEGKTYRLPTEAEWEYACRAGTTTAFGIGVDSLSAREANIDDGTPTATFAPTAAGTVGQANAWGLRDMHGNVWEWCADWSAPYATGEAVDPRGPADDTMGRVDLAMRVVRGGGWNSSASDARSSNRWEFSPVVATGYIGLRVVQEPELIAP